MRSILLAGVVLLAGSSAYAETIALSVGRARPAYRTEQAFRTVQVGNSSVVDVQALSDHAVTFQPKAPGGTNVLFLDERGEVIKDLDVVVSEGGTGTVQILTPGPRHSLSSIYRCHSRGCEFVKEDALQFPERVYRNINEDQGGQPAPAPPRAPRSDRD